MTDAEGRRRYEDLRARLECYANLEARMQRVSLQAEADMLQDEARFAKQVLRHHDERFRRTAGT